jgi:quinohemoprotein ethanol dehydrogenase
MLVAWDPVAQKEKWRGPANSAAGFNQGGTLSTAGNLVFGIGGGNRLVAYRADTGAVLAEFTLPISSPGPPMTYMIDNKQYIVVAGGPGGAGGGGGGGGGGRGGAGAAAAPAGNAPAAPAAGAATPAAGRGQRQ